MRVETERRLARSIVAELDLVGSLLAESPTSGADRDIALRMLWDSVDAYVSYVRCN